MVAADPRALALEAAKTTPYIVSRQDSPDRRSVAIQRIYGLVPKTASGVPRWLPAANQPPLPADENPNPAKIYRRPYTQRRNGFFRNG